MAVTIVRDADTDDDGSGTTGTIHNNAWKTAFYNRIDTALAALVTASGGDAWITPAFAAGDYTANGALVWTLQSGDVITFAYQINGKTMTVAFVLDTTTLSGTTDFKVFIKIPAAKTAAKKMIAPIWLNTTGTPESGYVQADAAGTNLTLFRTAQGNFTLGTNTAYFYGIITFEIQ